MRILAVDTATSFASFAIVERGAVLAAHDLGEGPAVSDRFPAALDSALRAQDIKAASFDRLAVTIGPGRFTGLRAGLAFMRAFALAADRPLVGITTLEALAAPACRDLDADKLVLAAVDSLRAEPFLQVFDGGGRAQGEAFACTPAALPERLRRDRRYRLSGERVDAIAAAMIAAGLVVEPRASRVDAVVLAELAAARDLAAAPAMPLYIHPPATTAPRSSLRLE
jgi:tRNA threonylcarbamoyladenosine biosynthesis protein TsaB